MIDYGGSRSHARIASGTSSSRKHPHQKALRLDRLVKSPGARFFGAIAGNIGIRVGKRLNAVVIAAA